MMSLQKLAELLPIAEIPEADISIKDIKMDHREVKPGDLFFCVPGFTVDGHDYADAALKNGAAALVVDREMKVSVPVIKVPDVRRAMSLLASHFFNHPSNHMKMVGVTGTNGKTSVTHFLEQMLASLNVNTGIIGTMYTKYGNVTLESRNTTPESLVLQRLLANMQKAEVETVTMEVSSHALANGRIHGTRFDVAIFTNLSQDHLDYHNTMEEYARAKSLLFAQLGNSYERYPYPVSVINEDDKYAYMMKEASSAPFITYGFSDTAMVRAENVQLTPEGSHFLMSAPGLSEEITLSLPGRFSIYNALAAASALFAQGIPWSKITPLLSQIQGVSGRFEPIESDAPVHTIVDYAHTPDSLQNVLETIQDVANRKIHVVVGCGGERDRSKRPEMARIAEAYGNFTYLTSDNPRKEDPKQILADMEAGMNGKDYLVIEDRKKAIFTAVERAEPDDVILIAGKGHETYQEIGSERFSFDDRIVAKMALKEWKE